MEAAVCGLPCDSYNDSCVKLSKDEVDTLQFRFGFPVKYLCHGHYEDQFSRYKGWHSRKCSDPCNRHKRVMKCHLREVSLELAKHVLQKTEFRVIPGKSICINCESYLHQMIEEAIGVLDEELEDKTDDEYDEDVNKEAGNNIEESEEELHDTPELDSPLL